MVEQLRQQMEARRAEFAALQKLREEKRQAHLHNEVDQIDAKIEMVRHYYYQLSGMIESEAMAWLQLMHEIGNVI